MFRCFPSLLCCPIRRSIGLVLSFVAGPVAVAWAQNFSAPTVYAVGTSPQGVALADVNGDARPDLIVTITGANAVSVLFNQPGAPGTFAALTTYANAGSFPLRVVARDVNADGRPDLLLALQQGGGVGVMLNSSSTPGTFLPTVTSSTLGNPRSLAVGDVDGDGRPDVVALNLDQGEVGVLLNSATAPGTFPATAAVYPTGGRSAQGVALGDVNGDGWLDIVAGGGGTGRVGVLLNRAAAPGTFAPVITYDSGGSYPQDVAVSDVNADGRPDIVVATGNSGSVGVLLNLASAPGTFPAQATTYSTGSRGAFSVALGDVNGDRRLDIVTGNYVSFPASASVGVLLNSATAPGTFPAVCTDFNCGGTSPHDVALGDVDGDGRLDIATVNYASSTVAVLRNTGTFLKTTVSSSSVDQLHLYPNPARGRVELTLPPTVRVVRVLDALGREHCAVPAANGRATLEAASLKPGLYLVRAAGLTQRLVVE